MSNVFFLNSHFELLQKDIDHTNKVFSLFVFVFGFPLIDAL